MTASLMYVEEDGRSLHKSLINDLLYYYYPVNQIWLLLMKKQENTKKQQMSNSGVVETQS